MKVMAWNCRGAGSSLTFPCAKEVIRLHSPSIVFLCETKNSSKYMRRFMRKMGYDDIAVVDPVGKAGGLAVMWKHDIQIENVLCTECSIEIKILDRKVGLSWWGVFVYGSTNANKRRSQWEMLTSRKSIWGEYRVVMGDFNDLVSNCEKWGGRVREEWSFKDFKMFIQENELADMGWEENPWTWWCNWDHDRNIKERLDRGLCSMPWIQSFPTAKVTHMETVASDHSILMLDTQPAVKKVRRRFTFDRKWLQYEEVDQVVSQAWNTRQQGSKSFKVTKKIKVCRMALLTWNKKLNGNAKEEINRIKGEIERAKQSPNGSGGQEIAIKLKELEAAYKKEEIFWAQKARNRWLREGDRNTAFFHAVVANKRRRNRISKIEKMSGGWCNTEQEMGEEIAKYFQHLFTSSQPSDFEEILGGIPRTITVDMNKSLTRPVSEDEIRRALFSMQPNTAPGPDGMSPIFYQKFWSIVKKDVVSAILNFFSNGFMSTAFNETLITLIPKIDSPSNLAHYRPISLCNVVYKIISKILANRMKVALKLCISQAQAAFVPGRQILDNVILAHEFVHHLNNMRSGKEGFMALKLDMSKAYDKVEWMFLAEVMNKMGFCPLWIKWVCNCINSVSYSFNVNGEKVGFIRPSRGIRQGDPLSPYLFLICAEGLSSLLKQAQDDGRITAMRISRNGPGITHLFFADDSLLFSKAKPEEAKEIRRILKVYKKASGQEINMEKSTIFFSKNTKEGKRSECVQHLEQIQHVLHGKYLGLPLVIGRSKNSVFGYIRDKALGKLNGWKGRLLSQAGKEVLLKSVVLAMPSYAMSVFKLSKNLCNDISKGMANFWWGDSEGKKKIHWKKWDELTKVKGAGGLGFRDIQLFNTALLAKQVWRFVSNPNLLVSKVVKAKYFPKTNIFEAKERKGASWIWQSFCSAIPLLEEGLRKTVGSGRSINIWYDRWVPGSPDGKISTSRPQDCPISTVSGLIEGGQWKKNLIKAMFSPDDCNRILSIPLSMYSRSDRFRWAHTSTGCYTVKSGYNAAKLYADQAKIQTAKEGESSRRDQRSRIWKHLWGLNLKHKVKHFIWKCLCGILPTNELLFRRTKKGCPICIGCGQDIETTEHLLFQCSKAVEIWKVSPLQWDGLKQHCWNFWDWWSHLLEAEQRPEGKKHIELTANLLWYIWKTRNEGTFNQEQRQPQWTVTRAIDDWWEFREALENDDRGDPVRNLLPGNLRREDFHQAAFTINTDAGLSESELKAGFGIVARDRQGKLHKTWAIPVEYRADPAILEAEAIRLALLYAIQENWADIIICSDCKVVIDKINNHELDESMLSIVICDILNLVHSFWCCSFCFVKREVNGVSHSLAKFAIKLIKEVKWETSFPMWLKKKSQDDDRALAQQL